MGEPPERLERERQNVRALHAAPVRHEHHAARIPDRFAE
jgi:hypothetical protein